MQSTEAPHGRGFRGFGLPRVTPWPSTLLLFGFFVIRWNAATLSRFRVISVLSLPLIVILYERLVGCFNVACSLWHEAWQAVGRRGSRQISLVPA